MNIQDRVDRVAVHAAKQIVRHGQIRLMLNQRDLNNVLLRRYLILASEIIRNCFTSEFSEVDIELHYPKDKLVRFFEANAYENQDVKQRHVLMGYAVLQPLWIALGKREPGACETYIAFNYHDDARKGNSIQSLKSVFHESVHMFQQAFVCSEKAAGLSSDVCVALIDSLVNRAKANNDYMAYKASLHERMAFDAEAIFEKTITQLMTNKNTPSMHRRIA